MTQTLIKNESRRDFLKQGLGLTLALYLPESATQAAETTSTGLASQIFAPNAFVKINADGLVTVMVKHLEMGQGVFTGLPTIVADELDAHIDQVRAEGAPADASRYNNLNWGPMQGTGGSSSVANSFDQLRKAGATARAMLVTAAANRWQVPASEITVSFGTIKHAASDRLLSFGDLAAEASALPVPENVPLKTENQFTYIGRLGSRLDNAGKVNGQAIYTQDIKLPNMVTALVAHPPRFGAKFKSVDSVAALASPGVVAVLSIENGVAVVAKDFWSAKKGRDLLNIQWDESQAMSRGSNELLAEYRQLAKNKPGLVARKDGDVEHELAGAKKVVEGMYEFPYLAHATMEPMNCVVQISSNGCEVWNGDQFQTGDQIALSRLLGLKPEQIKINALFAGGSFGRRANPNSDYVLEAARIAKALGTGVPVKMMWTREDDMRAGYFRPLYVHHIRAALNDKGQLSAWRHRIVGQSILAGTPFESVMVKNDIDGTSVEGASTLPYQIPNLQVELHTSKVEVPVQWWRSVGSTHTAYSTECMIDEMAAAARIDPVTFRQHLLANKPRHLGVLNLAVQKANWAKPLPRSKDGGKRGRGVAVHESFNTYVAQVAEVTIMPDKSIRVDRVVCAVDCGIAVTPDVITAQMEGGIGYGLSAALHGAITIDKGAVEQSNFGDYPVLRINEMPKIEVYIVASKEKPTGVGEPGTPVVAPAVANAIAAATGQRLRTLPFRLA